MGSERTLFQISIAILLVHIFLHPVKGQEQITEMFWLLECLQCWTSPSVRYSEELGRIFQVKHWYL